MVAETSDGGGIDTLCLTSVGTASAPLKVFVDSFPIAAIIERTGAAPEQSGITCVVVHGERRRQHGRPDHRWKPCARTTRYSLGHKHRQHRQPRLDLRYRPSPPNVAGAQGGLGVGQHQLCRQLYDPV
jgi:hypothetical protein